ncbi:MAG: hypothetical protein ACTSWZ_05315 [Candidatus Heimdallarchaeaceae archaeon]
MAWLLWINDFSSTRFLYIFCTNLTLLLVHSRERTKRSLSRTRRLIAPPPWKLDEKIIRSHGKVKLYSTIR